MKHSFSAGAVMIGPNNKVIVVSQHGTSWSLVKGTVEEGESLEETLRREVEEETGITKFEIIRKYPSYDRPLIGKDGGEDRNFLKTINMFLCTTPELELRPQDTENPEARWVDPNKVADLLTHPKDSGFYKSIQAEVLEFINTKNKENKTE